MLYKVVLIFPETKDLADFVEHLKVPGEVYGNDYTFVGNLTEAQIKIAQTSFNAYVRLVRNAD